MRARSGPRAFEYRWFMGRVERGGSGQAAQLHPTVKPLIRPSPPELLQFAQTTNQTHSTTYHHRSNAGSIKGKKPNFWVEISRLSRPRACTKDKLMDRLQITWQPKNVRKEKESSRFAHGIYEQQVGFELWDFSKGESPPSEFPFLLGVPTIRAIESDVRDGGKGGTKGFLGEIVHPGDDNVLQFASGPGDEGFILETFAQC
ncbi:hypothetical protein FB45DRAFT_999975 [Roridomyces roridus]|uniref:Uncharacterized protein n=1 Tax=Roridomyces roridus TaxID=1738132 RepID=A0AAD7FW00_9AGAR|nr:hypothetical protein FB45DRAFT_999975 [Roridomyces roridus]